MCGIAGQIRPKIANAGCDGGAVGLSVRAIAHRGPDDHGIYEDPAAGIALAHTRLSILDLSQAGHQPMASDDGSVVLTYNGEVYNYRDLRIALERDGVMFRGQSDTEVIIRLYEHLRPSSDSDIAAFLTSLTGIFALAIWDARRKELIVARDALGVKPLYWAQRQGSLAFASELKALLPFLHETPVLDATAIDQHLAFLWAPGTRTLWTGIQRLEPGTCLRATRNGTVRTFRWYTLPAHRRVHVPRKTESAAKLEEQTLQHVQRAVQRQMVADVPVGAFLSGGLDSSTIVHFARQVKPDLQCFTIQADGPSDPGFVDDLPYACTSAKALGVDLHVVRASAEHLAQDLEQMVWHLDEPVADPAALNVLHISRAARSQGIKVLLSGVGADDLFTGYRRHLSLNLERYWSWLPQGARRALRRLTSSAPAASAFGMRLRKAFAGAHLPADERLVHYFRWIDRADLRRLYSPAMSAAVKEQGSEDPMMEFLGSLPAGNEPMDRMLALEQRFFLADHNLMYTDKMSMAVGVEVRVPFLDLDLVEFAASVPNALKQRGRHGKWILKRAMEPYLPRDIVHRQKTGFSVPLARWMRHELRDWIWDTLSEQNLRRRGLFDPPAVHRLLTDNARGGIHAPYTILSLACIEVWCRRFIDQRTPPHAAAGVPDRGP